MDMRKVQLPGTTVAAPKAAPARTRIYASLLVAVVVLLAAGLWFYGRGAAVTTAPVVRGSAAEIVYATGAVEPDRWARVATLITGRIIERCRCEGQAVKTGDLLARLDDSEPRAALHELYARREFTHNEYERQAQLMARGATSAQAHERAATELHQIEGLIEVQKERISNYRLVSPMDGIVLREDGEVGEIVTSNTILYRIGLPTPLLLVAEVNEEDIPRVKVGQTVLLRSDAFAGQRLTGTVRDVTPAGDPVARTYRIRIALPDDTPLRVGMSVEANIVAREVKEALLVPAAAVSRDAVYVVDQSRAVQRPVEIGIRGTQMVEIRSGLKQGDRVVSPIPPDLQDRARIRDTGEASTAAQ
jgi:RND family efflux transporter MFP subunit